MKEFYNLNEIAESFGVKYVDVIKNYDEQAWRGKFFVDNKEIKIESINNELKYVYVDEKDNQSCKDYLMKYAVPKYDWKVYVDDLEGWQNCTVLNIDNNGLDIIRATVEMKNETKIDELVKYSCSVDCVIPSKNIFMIEKDEREFEENDFFTTKNKILLLTDSKWGYFLDPKNNKIECIAFKDSGFESFADRDLDYLKGLIETCKNDRISLDGFEFTLEGRFILGIERDELLYLKNI